MSDGACPMSASAPRTTSRSPVTSSERRSLPRTSRTRSPGSTNIGSAPSLARLSVSSENPAWRAPSSRITYPPSPEGGSAHAESASGPGTRSILAASVFTQGAETRRRAQSSRHCSTDIAASSSDRPGLGRGSALLCEVNAEAPRCIDEHLVDLLDERGELCAGRCIWDPPRGRWVAICGRVGSQLLDLPERRFQRVLLGHEIDHIVELVPNPSVLAFGRKNGADDLFGCLLAEIRCIAVATRGEYTGAVEVFPCDAEH